MAAGTGIFATSIYDRAYMAWPESQTWPFDSYPYKKEIHMKKQSLRTILFVTLALSVVPVSVLGYAADNGNAPICTLKTLKGRYLFAHSGTIVPPAFGVTAPTPGADAGFHIFNGDGTGTDIVTFRINGVTVLENQAVPISYTVNADCTGRYTALIPGGPSFNLFIAPDGESIATIARDPGNYVSDIDRMVSQR
jgi:hypothetical protein